MGVSGKAAKHRRCLFRAGRFAEGYAIQLHQGIGGEDIPAGNLAADSQGFTGREDPNRGCCRFGTLLIHTGSAYFKRNSGEREQLAAARRRRSQDYCFHNRNLLKETK